MHLKTLILFLIFMKLFGFNISAQKQRRPQEPMRPFPYIEKEVTFTNPIDGTILNGTLTLPDETKKYPAVILITGSGAQNRDEEILGHKPFLVIADYLTRNGIAVLRYDDRHFNMPIKEGWKYTTADLATDTKAALDFLRTNKNISQIGLLGHSEGGVIAPLIASEDTNVAFVISLAGTGLSGYKIAIKQWTALAKDQKELNFSQKALHVIANEPNIDERRKKLKSINNEVYGKFNFTAKANLRKMIDMSISEWNRFFINYDPAEAWKKVRCPVLALNGTHDIQVIAGENLQAIKQALQLAQNPDYTILEIPKANHLFQIVESGDNKDYLSLISEYRKLEQTISPDVLKLLGDWIIQKTRPE